MIQLRIMDLMLTLRDSFLSPQLFRSMKPKDAFYFEGLNINQSAFYGRKEFSL